jgi:hypothetical protein
LKTEIYPNKKASCPDKLQESDGQASGARLPGKMNCEVTQFTIHNHLSNSAQLMFRPKHSGISEDKIHLRGDWLL